MHRSFYEFKVLFVDICAKHFSLGSRMFTVRLQMDGEILVMLRIAEAVMLFQSVDFRLTDRWNLAFVSVEGGQTFGCRPVSSN